MTARKSSIRISTILHVLLGLMLTLIIGALLIPIYSDILQKAEGETALNNARAARMVLLPCRLLELSEDQRGQRWRETSQHQQNS